MEKSKKEMKALVVACVVFGISVGYSMNYIFLNYDIATGFNAKLFFKILPFICIDISMTFYAIGLLKKIKHSAN